MIIFDTTDDESFSVEFALILSFSLLKAEKDTKRKTAKIQDNSFLKLLIFNILPII